MLQIADQNTCIINAPTENIRWERYTAAKRHKQIGLSSRRKEMPTSFIARVYYWKKCDANFGSPLSPSSRRRFSSWARCSPAFLLWPRRRWPS